MRRKLRQTLVHSTRDLRESKQFGFIKGFMQGGDIWHVTQHSVARAAAIGIFVAYLPMPFQMGVAALLALVLRANLPIAVLLIWISNPLTWLVLYAPPYMLGAALLGQPEVSMQSLTVSWIMQNLSALWLGCLIVGAAMAAGAFLTVHVLWRMEVVGEWEQRRDKRRAKRQRRAKQQSELFIDEDEAS